jgi:hypothetical protein
MCFCNAEGWCRELVRILALVMRMADGGCDRSMDRHKYVGEYES